MNLKAIRAVLEALSGKCKEDMAGKFSSPDEKMDEALMAAKDPEEMEEDEVGDGSGLSLDELAKEEVAEEDDEPSGDPVADGLKQFFKSRKPAPTKPGTAIMIAVDKKKPVGKPFAKKA